MTPDIPQVETERLLLRGLCEVDLDDFAAMMADERVARWFGGPPSDRATAWRTMALFLGHWSLRGHGQWAAVEKSSGRFVGRVGLWQPEGWPGLEVGWAITPDQWGQGYATEGGRASVAWAFDNLGVGEVISVTLPENLASRRVMEKVGLRHDRTEQVAGHEQVIYATTAGAWNRDDVPQAAKR